MSPIWSDMPSALGLAIIKCCKVIVIKEQKTIFQRGTYIAQLSFQDYLVVIEEHLDLPLKPLQLCSQLSRHLLRQPTSLLNCCHCCFQTSESLSRKILGRFTPVHECLMPNIKVEVFKACTDEKQTSSAPHRMWEILKTYQPFMRAVESYICT